MSVREASHAGSWYSSSATSLTGQLDEWLAQVPAELPGTGKTPIPGARAIISPHAGYTYSGPCAAWAYRSLDLQNIKRIFILYPSHHVHLSTLALPSVQGYSTPLSTKPLPLDLPTIQHLLSLKVTVNNRQMKFTTMDQYTDEAEHSAEMQLPFLHRLLQKLYPDRVESDYPPLVPIMVGSTQGATEAAFGKVLAPYFGDTENAIILSSDFCHWGSHFRHTYFVPSAPSPALSLLNLPNGTVEDATHDSCNELSSAEPYEKLDVSQARNLVPREVTKSGEPAIHESIAYVDRACMSAITFGSQDVWLDVLGRTGNTVCGRHPIGVFLAGWEEVTRFRKVTGEDAAPGTRKSSDTAFRFIRYERSNLVRSVKDSSVSYVSAFAVLD